MTLKPPCPTQVHKPSDPSPCLVIPADPLLPNKHKHCRLEDQPIMHMAFRAQPDLAPMVSRPPTAASRA